MCVWVNGEPGKGKETVYSLPFWNFLQFRSSVHQCFTATCRMNTDLLMNALFIFTFFWWAYGIEGRRRPEEGGLFVPRNSSVKAKSITSSSGFWDSWPESTWSPLKISYFVSCFVFLKFPGKSLHLYSELGRKYFFLLNDISVYMHIHFGGVRAGKDSDDRKF